MMLFPETPHRKCAYAALSLEKGTKVSRELLARDPLIILESTPMGFYCHFSNGESRLVLECVLCIFEQICTLEDKRKLHSGPVTAHGLRWQPRLNRSDVPVQARRRRGAEPSRQADHGAEA
jgi:hypothetical protein